MALIQLNICLQPSVSSLPNPALLLDLIGFQLGGPSEICYCIIDYKFYSLFVVIGNYQS